MPAHEFWPLFTEIVESQLPPLLSGYGASEQSLDIASERLGIAIPALLREYYIRTGSRTDINSYMNRLIPLDHIFIDQDRLVFFE